MSLLWLLAGLGVARQPENSRTSAGDEDAGGAFLWKRSDMGSSGGQEQTTGDSSVLWTRSEDGGYSGRQVPRPRDSPEQTGVDVVRAREEPAMAAQPHSVQSAFPSEPTILWQRQEGVTPSYLGFPERTSTLNGAPGGHGRQRAVGQSSNLPQSNPPTPRSPESQPEGDPWREPRQALAAASLDSGPEQWIRLHATAECRAEDPWREAGGGDSTLNAVTHHDARERNGSRAGGMGERSSVETRGAALSGSAGRTGRPAGVRVRDRRALYNNVEYVVSQPLGNKQSAQQ
jgi:hypothetical protein